MPKEVPHSSYNNQEAARLKPGLVLYINLQIGQRESSKCAYVTQRPRHDDGYRMNSMQLPLRHSGGKVVMHILTAEVCFWTKDSHGARLSSCWLCGKMSAKPLARPELTTQYGDVKTASMPGTSMTVYIFKAQPIGT